MKTKDKIVNKALELFNRYGVNNVALHRVAAELGISPGNLTYHYKTKNDLIKAIYPMAEKSLKNALELPEDVERPLSVSFVASFQINFAKALWQHRFLFVSLQSIMERDNEFEQEYEQFHDWIIARLQKLLDNEIENKNMKPVPAPNTTAVIAANQWYVWVAFLLLQSHENNVKRLKDQELICIGIIKSFSILLPYCSENFPVAFIEECRKQLGVELDNVSVPNVYSDLPTNLVIQH